MRSILTVAAIGAAGTIVARASIPVLAATTSGVRYQDVQSTSVLGPNSTQCSAMVLSAAVSAGDPAYASAMVSNTLASACSGWLQSSVDDGAWADVSPEQSVPGGQPLNGQAWHKTADYYAGPGTRLRACIEQASAAATTCTGPVSLAASTATPASDATSVYYAHQQQAANASSGDGPCFSYLYSSTTSKTATSQVNMILGGAFALTCTGWFESSTNNAAPGSRRRRPTPSARPGPNSPSRRPSPTGPASSSAPA